METENVRKQLKIFGKCYGVYANINIQSKCHVPTIICFRVALKTKIDFLENRIYIQIPGFP